MSCLDEDNRSILIWYMSRGMSHELSGWRQQIHTDLICQEGCLMSCLDEDNRSILIWYVKRDVSWAVWMKTIDPYWSDMSRGMSHELSGWRQQIHTDLICQEGCLMSCLDEDNRSILIWYVKRDVSWAVWMKTIDPYWYWYGSSIKVYATMLNEYTSLHKLRYSYVSSFTNLSPFFCFQQFEIDVLLWQGDTGVFGRGHWTQWAVICGWLQDDLKSQAATLLSRLVHWAACNTNISSLKPHTVIGKHGQGAQRLSTTWHT